MANIDLLLKLQEIDLSLDDAIHQLHEVESQLHESADVVATRQELAAIRAELHEIETTLRNREWDVSNLDEKSTTIEKKLYGGTVRNPRELNDLQTELEHLKANKRRIEDQILDRMDQIEKLRAREHESAERLRDLTAAWEAEQADLIRRRAELKKEATGLATHRRDAVAPIAPELLARYEELRRTRRGRALARIERDTCQGCRTSLSLREIQLVRSGRQIGTCGSCGRILYIPR